MIKKTAVPKKKKKSLKIQKISTKRFGSVIHLLFLPPSSCSNTALSQNRLKSFKKVHSSYCLVSCFNLYASNERHLTEIIRQKKKRSPFFFSVSDGTFSNSSSNPRDFRLVGSCNIRHRALHKRTAMVLMAKWCFSTLSCAGILALDKVILTFSP